MVAPVQPMSTVAQSNLQGMRDELLSWNPMLPAWMADKFLNNALFKIMDRRVWSGLLVKDQIIVPDAFTTGTVSLTQSSNVVTGSGTGWATNDLVNTTLSSAVTDLGILTDLIPASMTNINLGDWLTIAGGTVNEEQCLVVSVTATTFRTSCTLSHVAGATVWKSSLARQQLRVTESAPFYSITGVSSTTQLKLDGTWGAPTASAQSYSISQVYVVFGNNCKFVMEMANLNRRYQVGLHFPQASVNAYDPQRSATESTYMLLDLTPDEVGRPRYELYPRPTSSQVFAVLYYRVVNPMQDDEDTPPPFIRSDVLVAGALAEAMRYRMKENTYYDSAAALQISREKQMEFERSVIEMTVADDNVYMMNLKWDFGSWPGYGQSSNWRQSHDEGIASGDF